MENQLTPWDKKTDDWEITVNRFVAFIDILGFKDMVARSSQEDIYNKMVDLHDILDNALNIEKNKILMNEKHKIELSKNSVYYVMFSDSIAIITKDNSWHAFLALCAQLQYFLAETLKKQIPFKGSFAYGQLTVDKEKNIILGQPLIDAYLLEEELNYMGIVAHHSIDSYIEHISKTETIRKHVMDLICLPEIKTPLKSGKFTHRNICCVLTYNNYYQILTKNDIEKFRLNSSGNVRKYVDNTLDVMKDLDSTHKIRVANYNELYKRFYANYPNQ